MQPQEPSLWFPLWFDVDIVKEYKQQYIAYKSETNFVNIRPSKNELTIAFNIPFDKIKDEKGLCKNYTGIGNFANNDVLLKADENVDLDYVIDLAMQALIYQLEG
jgi:predicted transport protein